MGKLLVIFPVVMAVLVLSLCTSNVEAAVGLPQPVKLERQFYKVHNTCENAENFIRHQVKIYWDHDKSITPKLLKLLYSDCFVTGCDGSILLDGPNSEKTAIQNRGLRAFVLIDKIKIVLEDRCPGVVSCADILNLAARDAVHFAGAPSYPVLLGRRDGMSSSKESVNLPSASMSWQETLAYFESKGLDVLDMTTLLGSHSMGRTFCRNIEDRLYNFNNTRKPDPTMNTTLLEAMKKQCPPRTKKGQGDPLVYLNQESGSSYKYTNSYYSRILTHEAILGVDQQLLYGEDSGQIVEEFAANLEDFRRSFALSMVRMGGINVLTGKQGEIRRNCRYTNKDNPY